MTTLHPSPHYKFRDPLSPKFASLIQSSARTNWGYGFLLIRTAPIEKDESLDALIWHTAMTRLFHNGYDPSPPGSMDYDVLPDPIILPVMSDPSLPNLSPCDLRSRYLTWVDDFRLVYSTIDEHGNTIDGFEALGVSGDIKWDHCFLVVDEASLRSLMAPPFGYHPSHLQTNHHIPNPKRQRREKRSEYPPWVIAVDTTVPFDSPSPSALPYKYNGDKAPYPGWMRCSASSLEQLWNDIDMLDSFEEQIYPGRTYAGEVPLYTGGLPGRSGGLLRTTDEDEDNNTKGRRYKFPVLPGRGIREKQKVEELVKEIEQVTGRKLEHDVCDCLGGRLL